LPVKKLVSVLKSHKNAIIEMTAGIIAMRLTATFRRAIKTNFDARTNFVFLRDGHVMEGRIVLTDQTRSIAPSNVRTCNSFAQREILMGHRNALKRA
jgi:hypothetical protein